MNHVGTPPFVESIGSYQAIQAFSGIPTDKLRGFRTPFLLYNTDSFKAIHDSNKFLYDSSVEHHPLNARFWPFTLDYGLPVECYTGSCDGNFKFPGLWEIPLYSLLNADQSINAAMDPNPVGTINASETLNLLKYNFLYRYNGNRLPLGIYIHASAQASVAGAFKEFISWTLANYPDVYWVNNQQLISWIQNPTNIKGSLTNPALDCMMPATDASNEEICDGIDNNGNGQIDEGVVMDCGYDGSTYFKSCFGCPKIIPNITSAVPPLQVKSRTFINTSCPNSGVWNPILGSCLSMKRIAKSNSFKLFPDSPQQNPKSNLGLGYISMPIVSIVSITFILFLF